MDGTVVIGPQGRVCAECGELRLARYHGIGDGVYIVIWIHLDSGHVSCYNSIQAEMLAGTLVRTGSFEWRIGREYRRWD